MDFIQLANAAHETSRAIVRMLLEQQDDNDDSDDFVRIENEPSMSRYHGSSPEGTTNLQRVDDVDYSITGGGGGGVPQMEDRPFLSPTAESALLSLCTNFLLYVAMVLITVLVARIYFPSWLEPRSGVDATGGDGAPTRVRELRALSTTFEDDDEEDDEDDDEEEEEFIGTVKINTPRREEERKKGYSDNLVDILDAY